MAITTVQGNPEEMPKGVPFYGRRMELATRYCQGSGIELGAAAHNPFDLPNSINVAPFSDDPSHVDYNDFLIYREEQVKNCGYYAVVDLVGEADAIPITDGSQDYVISSHVIEHLPNLISAFLEWNRVLVPGGIIFMIFPKRDAAPQDLERPVTPLDHFIEDYSLKRTIWTHEMEEDRIRGHYHVFTLSSMLELIQWCNQNLNLSWKVEAAEETDSKIGNGHTVVCRYLPGEMQAWVSSAVKVNRQSRFAYVWMRMEQRLRIASQIIASEGFAAFFNQFIHWLSRRRNR
jgi:SAM-dependent methyltransferase